MRFDGTNRGFRYSSEGAWVAAHLPERDLGGLPHTCSSQINGGAIFVIELCEFPRQRPQAADKPAMEIARTAFRQASGAGGKR